MNELPVTQSGGLVIAPSLKPFRRWYCLICARTFKNKNDLDRHKRIHAARRLPDKPAQGPANKPLCRPFKCEEPNCGKSFRRRSEISIHIMTHRQDRSFACPICPRRSKYKSNIQRHIRMHNALPKHRCANCKKLFFRLEEMQEHVQTHFQVHDRNDLPNEASKANSAIPAPPMSSVVPQRYILASNAIIGTPVLSSTPILGSTPTFLNPYTGQIYALNIVQSTAPTSTPLTIEDGNERARILDEDVEDSCSDDDDDTTNDYDRAKEKQIESIIAERRRQRVIEEQQDQLKEKRRPPPDTISRQKERLEEQQTNNSTEIVKINQHVQNILRSRPNDNARRANRSDVDHDDASIVDRMATVLNKVSSSTSIIRRLSSELQLFMAETTDDNEDDADEESFRCTEDKSWTVGDDNPSSLSMPMPATITNDITYNHPSSFGTSVSTDNLSAFQVKPTEMTTTGPSRPTTPTKVTTTNFVPIAPITSKPPPPPVVYITIPVTTTPPTPVAIAPKTPLPPRPPLPPRTPSPVPCFQTDEDVSSNTYNDPQRCYKCQKCHKAFHAKSDLQRHIRIHTGEKPFQCTLCPKAFYQRSDLNRHGRTHTGDRPFKCDFCAKAFSQKSDLTRHEKRLHEGRDADKE